MCIEIGPSLFTTTRKIENKGFKIGFIPKIHDRIDQTIQNDTLPTFLKMDVEGAEMEALKGSATILFTQKPNLAISIHHKTTDAFEIINYLNSLNCGYKFRIGYHGPYSKTDVNVILYATAK